MATNYEKIQEDLATCNVTLWEPPRMADLQLNLCRLKCAEQEITAKATSLEAVKEALVDIESISTSDSEIEDVTFSVTKSDGVAYVWAMIPKASGDISFSLNTKSEFFDKFILPAVSVDIVSLTGEGGLAKTDHQLRKDRLQALENSPVNVIDTTISAVAKLLSIITAKRETLEAEHE